MIPSTLQMLIDAAATAHRRYLDAVATNDVNAWRLWRESSFADDIVHAESEARARLKAARDLQHSQWMICEHDRLIQHCNVCNPEKQR